MYTEKLILQGERVKHKLVVILLINIPSFSLIRVITTDQIFKTFGLFLFYKNQYFRN